MFGQISNVLSSWAIPLLLLLVLCIGYYRKINVYEAFIDGASEGFQTTIRIMPFLVAMMVAINIFHASGALELCVTALKPVLSICAVPAELIPLAIMRPLSGTGCLGLITELFSTFGPDSLLGKMASTILGSTDTTFYILTVYFGAIGISHPRYAVFVGIVGDITGFLGSIYLCRFIFS